MRRLLTLVGMMIGLCSGSVPAWATCEFTPYLTTGTTGAYVKDAATCNAFINALATKAINQLKSENPNLKLGSTGIGYGINLVPNCKSGNDYFITVASKKNHIVNLCIGFVADGYPNGLPDLNLTTACLSAEKAKDATTQKLQKNFYEAFGKIFASCVQAPPATTTTTTSPPSGGDKDGDAVPDSDDNCPTVKNTAQADMDKDLVGDHCDTDIDGDALSNNEEIAYTNPAFPGCKPDWLKPDTDGDKLSDNQEGIYKTNPCSPDTDGDTIDDLKELKGDNPSACPTDPLIKDSDKDDLEDGEEINKYLTNPCLNADKDGDKLTDADEILIYLTDYSNAVGDLDTDGLTDADEIFKYETNWNVKDTDGDGLKDGDEIKYGTDATLPNGAKADLDKDNLSDAQEILKYFTNWNNPDHDGDGLLDGEEVKSYKTNPLKPDDTDGDGLMDGAEIHKYHTDRKDSDSDNDGLSDGDEVNGKNPYNWKSDPTKDHSDADGIKDGAEVNGLNSLGYKSNPDDEESDGDGLHDDIELKKGTNPWDDDSDNDGMDDGADNCPTDPNTEQVDTDGDGTGDVCQQLCDQKCGNLPSCQEYEAKKQAAFSYQCKLPAAISTVYLGKDAQGNATNSWECKQGEGCFCALPIYLNTCVNAQAACETQYCQKNDKSKVTLVKKSMMGECDFIKKMAKAQAQGEQLGLQNPSELLTKMISLFKEDGANGLGKLKNVLAQQLGFYLQTSFTAVQIEKALFIAVKMLKNSWGANDPDLQWSVDPAGAAEGTWGAHIHYNTPTPSLMDSDYIVYNGPLFEYVSKNAVINFSPHMIASFGSHESAHAFMYHLVYDNASFSEVMKTSNTNIVQTKLSGSSLDFTKTQHIMMKLIEFSLGSASFTGTEETGQSDTTNNNFKTAEEMLKNNAKWQNLQCPNPQ